MQGAVDAETDAETVGLRLDMNVRDAVAESLGDDEVDDLHHRRVRTHRGELRHLRLPRCLFDRAHYLRIDVRHHRVVQVERMLYRHSVGQLEPHLPLGHLRQLLAYVRCVRTVRGHVQSPVLVDLVRENVVLTRECRCDAVERSVLRLHRVKIDGHQP